MSKKPHILFIQPLYFNPTLPNFKDKFVFLSRLSYGHVISPSDRKYDGLHFGDFIYHALPNIQNKLKRHIHYVIEIIKTGIRIHKSKPLDIIVSYDPLLYGFCASVLKYLTKAKLVIEINGHLKKDAFLKSTGLKAEVKRMLFIILTKISLFQADHVKFLNKDQILDWNPYLKNKKTHVFFNFVPTHVFDVAKARNDNYILFMGHPFHRKGVDILIKAFIKISGEFKDITLKIIGHCHGRESERQHYLKMSQGNPRVEILKPVFYNEAIEYFQNCTLFVLPSRSEAMGRVMLEAMACGKAIIGSNVGGIPFFIQNGINGFLFESENIEDLSMKIKHLLKDHHLRGEMGKRALQEIKKRYSPECYLSYFQSMIEEHAK